MPKKTKDLLIKETSSRNNTFTEIIINYILSQLEKEKKNG